MYGFLAGFSFPGSIFAKKNTYFLFCHHFKKQEISNLFSKNGFRRTKTGQKAEHWAHPTYEVTIDVK